MYTLLLIYQKYFLYILLIFVAYYLLLSMLPVRGNEKHAMSFYIHVMTAALVPIIPDF